MAGQVYTGGGAGAIVGFQILGQTGVLLSVEDGGQGEEGFEQMAA